MNKNEKKFHCDIRDINQIAPPENNRLIAFAKFVKVNNEDDADAIIDNGDNHYSYYGDDYWVLTYEEAEQKAKEEIKMSVWAFAATFIAAHVPKGITAEDITSLRGMRSEDANQGLLALIEAGNGFDHFAEDAISADGIGHYLNNYDGNEHEVDEFYIYQFS